MFDKFDGHSQSLESPATTLVEVTPDDGADLPWASRAIAVAETGTIALITVDDSVGTIFVVAGAPFPIRARRILVTGTTATGIVALA